MKITFNIPDSLVQDVDVERDYKHTNRTQYLIRALTNQVQADRLTREQPKINDKLNELKNMLEQLEINN